jgi:hypothetical protein
MTCLQSRLNFTSYPPQDKAELDGFVRSAVGYVTLIHQQMDVRRIGLRGLAATTHVGLSRLGRILHRDPAKRLQMTLLEQQAILHALDLDLIEATIAIEIFHHLDWVHDDRFAKLSSMLSMMIRGLPQIVIDALRDFDTMDGSEIRPEWGLLFQKGVTNKLVLEVGRILERRALLAERSDSFLF